LIPYTAEGTCLTPLHVFASVQRLSTDLDKAKTEPCAAHAYFESMSV